MSKTINSRDSLVVTHPTTSLPAYGFSTAERTGSPVFLTLWSIAKIELSRSIYKQRLNIFNSGLLFVPKPYTGRKTFKMSSV